MATNKKNKVKFGLQNVYWAKINEWGEDPDGNKTVPAYGPSKHLPGAVSLSIDANGEAENFFADNGVYYVINNISSNRCRHCGSYRYRCRSWYRKGNFIGSRCHSKTAGG